MTTTFSDRQTLHPLTEQLAPLLPEGAKVEVADWKLEDSLWLTWFSFPELDNAATNVLLHIIEYAEEQNKVIGVILDSEGNEDEAALEEFYTQNGFIRDEQNLLHRHGSNISLIRYPSSETAPVAAVANEEEVIEVSEYEQQVLSNPELSLALLTGRQQIDEGRVVSKERGDRYE